MDTVTGSVLLDRLLLPFWKLFEWWQLRRLDRVLGITGSSRERWERRAELFREAF